MSLANCRLTLPFVGSSPLSACRVDGCTNHIEWAVVAVGDDVKLGHEQPKISELPNGEPAGGKIALVEGEGEGHCPGRQRVMEVSELDVVMLARVPT